LLTVITICAELLVLFPVMLPDCACLVPCSIENSLLAWALIDDRWIVLKYLKANFGLKGINKIDIGGWIFN
jgi:hypothetical protein